MKPIVFAASAGTALCAIATTVFTASGIHWSGPDDQTSLDAATQYVQKHDRFDKAAFAVSELKRSNGWRDNSSSNAYNVSFDFSLTAKGDWCQIVDQVYVANKVRYDRLGAEIATKVASEEDARFLLGIGVWLDMHNVQFKLFRDQVKHACGEMKSLNTAGADDIGRQVAFKDAARFAIEHDIPAHLQAGTVLPRSITAVFIRTENGWILKP